MESRATSIKVAKRALSKAVMNDSKWDCYTALDTLMRSDLEPRYITALLYAFRSSKDENLIIKIAQTRDYALCQAALKFVGRLLSETKNPALIEKLLWSNLDSKIFRRKSIAEHLFKPYFHIDDEIETMAVDLLKLIKQIVRCRKRLNLSLDKHMDSIFGLFNSQGYIDWTFLSFIAKSKSPKLALHLIDTGLFPIDNYSYFESLSGKMFDYICSMPSAQYKYFMTNLMKPHHHLNHFFTEYTSVLTKQSMKKEMKKFKNLYDPIFVRIINQSSAVLFTPKENISITQLDKLEEATKFTPHLAL